MSNTRFQPAKRLRRSLALPVVALLAAVLAGCGGDSQEVDQETTSTLIQPVARVELQAEEAEAEAEAPAEGDAAQAEAGAGEQTAAGDAAAEGGEAAAEEAPAAAAGRGGEEVYKASCSVCHAAGVAGAPVLGNEEQWAPRIEKGLDANVASVINGLGAMPPRGGSNATDEELQATVIYMMNESGADL